MMAYGSKRGLAGVTSVALVILCLVTSAPSVTLAAAAEPSAGGETGVGSMDVTVIWAEGTAPDDPTPDDPTPDNPTPDDPTPDEPTPDDPTPKDDTEKEKETTESPSPSQTPAAQPVPAVMRDNLTRTYDVGNDVSKRDIPTWNLIQTGDFDRGIVSSALIAISMLFAFLFWRRSGEEEA